MGNAGGSRLGVSPAPLPPTSPQQLTLTREGSMNKYRFYVWLGLEGLYRILGRILGKEPSK